MGICFDAEAARCACICAVNSSKPRSSRSGFGLKTVCASSYPDAHAAAVRSAVVTDDDEPEEEEVREEVIREVDDVLLNEFNLVRVAPCDGGGSDFRLTSSCYLGLQPQHGNMSKL